ncbi:MAG: hypothetical protein RI973_133 [Bacteroidota bacterium]|jgi:small subunit ribosomal protein S8
MVLTDPIADFLTRIRNAQQAGHRVVEIPASKEKKAITEILFDNGYILNYKFDDAAGKNGIIKIAIKYDALTRRPVIQDLKRVSRPGLRQYRKADDLPKVINGLGIAIISTSKGIMSDKQAREHHVGGEVLCYIQ